MYYAVQRWKFTPFVYNVRVLGKNEACEWVTYAIFAPFTVEFTTQCTKKIQLVIT